MKKSLLALIALALSGGAFASAGTITFQGSVTDQTCAITVEGVADPTVVLQPATVQSLKDPGSSAGLKTFNVHIGGCAADQVGIQLIPIEANTNSGILVNTLTTGNAQNVGFQLLNGSQPINLSSANTSDLTILKPKVGDTVDVTIPIGVQYYSVLGGATAGAVQSSIQYAITYQ